MAHADRTAAAAVKEELSRRAPGGDFFATLPATLDYLAKVNGVTPEQAAEYVRYRAAATLGFPASDVAALEFLEYQGRELAEFTVTFTGLYGPASPLPAHDTEVILQEEENVSTIRDFLDVFNTLSTRHFYRIWQKYRYYMLYRAGGADRFTGHMYSLLGLGNNLVGRGGNVRWLRILYYIGMLSFRSHSSALIETVLRRYFLHDNLHIEECVYRRVAVPSWQLAVVGQRNVTLGGDCTLGYRVPDRSGKFRIHIRDLHWDTFCLLLPGSAYNRTLHHLTQFMLRDHFEYDLRLQLKKSEIPTLVLDKHCPCRLGWSTWLGREHADGIVTLTTH